MDSTLSMELTEITARALALGKVPAFPYSPDVVKAAFEQAWGTRDQPANWWFDHLRALVADLSGGRVRLVSATSIFPVTRPKPYKLCRLAGLDRPTVVLTPSETPVVFDESILASNVPRRRRWP